MVSSTLVAITIVFSGTCVEVGTGEVVSLHQEPFSHGVISTPEENGDWQLDLTVAQSQRGIYIQEKTLHLCSGHYEILL